MTLTELQERFPNGGEVKITRAEMASLLEGRPDKEPVNELIFQYNETILDSMFRQPKLELRILAE